MGCSEVFGALLRAGASEAGGGFGHVGHGGHDGGIGSESRSVGSFVRRPQADVCLARERWPVASHCCDPGMNRDLTLCPKTRSGPTLMLGGGAISARIIHLLGLRSSSRVTPCAGGQLR